MRGKSAHIKGTLGKATLGLYDVILPNHDDLIVVGVGPGQPARARSSQYVLLPIAALCRALPP